MPGFSSSASTSTNVVFANNADFTGNPLASPNPSDTNGLQTNGQLWIGSTATNAGNTHINVGRITSPLGTLTIGYATPNITIDLVGGSTGIDTIGVDATSGGGTNPVLPTAAGLVTVNGAIVAAGTNPIRSVSTAANVYQIQVQASQSLAAADTTRIGLSNFDSTSFAVTTGFVTLVGGGFTWNDVSGAFSPLKNNGYFITGTATGTLPAAPAQGDTIKFFVDTTQILTIDAPGTQIIRIAELVTSAGGTAVSTLQGDSLELVYRTSDTCWCSIGGGAGVWTIT